MHVVGAINAPLDFINNHRDMDIVSKTKTCYVHCLEGFWSLIFNTIMRTRRFYDLIDITEGFESIIETKTPVTEHVERLSML